MTGDDRIEVLVGWVLTAIYLFWFSKKYFDSSPYSTSEQRGAPHEPLELALATQPIYPRFAAPSRQYWTWFLLFFCYVWALYFIIQMVLDAALLPDGSLADLEQNVWVKTFPQLLAALVIFGGVDRIPQLRRVLSTVRNMFHESASIPRRARMMINSIRAFPKTFTEHEIALAQRASRFVEAGDGSAPPDSTAYKFLYACFLLNTIERRANSSRAYDRFVHDPESGYSQTRAQLDYVERIIAENLRNQDRRFHGDAADRIVDALFRNASQLYVSATVTASRRFSRTIRSIVLDGVPIQIYREFRYQIGHAFVTNILILVVLFFALFLVFAVWRGAEIQSPPAIAAAKSVLGTVLIVSIPVVSTYMLKVAAVDEWPLGYDGHERSDHLQHYVLAALVGLLISLIGFFILAEYRVFDDAGTWAQMVRLAPWSAVPAVICFIAAYSLDNTPRTFDRLRAARHSFVAGLAGAFGSGLVAVMIQMIVHRSELHAIADPESVFWTEALGLVAAAVVVGFLFGGYVSLISDLGTRLPKSTTIGEHYFFRFLLGQVLSSELPKEAWVGLNIDPGAFPSPEVVQVLKDEGFVTAEMTLTQKGVDLLTDPHAR
ncbi:MAG: hypothetical protein ACMVY4_06835 [Minwuia sp.]|uniref:hypothetical protein n=1 Tax=Minwuia sp. TaxID=2493630 RepID=UPI003A862A24